MKLYSNFSLVTVLSLTGILTACGGNKGGSDSLPDAAMSISPAQLKAAKDINTIPAGSYKLSLVTTYRKGSANLSDCAVVHKLNTPGAPSKDDRTKMHATNFKTGTCEEATMIPALLTNAIVAGKPTTSAEDADMKLYSNIARKNKKLESKFVVAATGAAEDFQVLVPAFRKPGNDYEMNVGTANIPGTFPADLKVNGYHGHGVVLVEGNQVRIIIESNIDSLLPATKLTRVIQVVYKKQ